MAFTTKRLTPKDQSKMEKVQVLAVTYMDQNLDKYTDEFMAILRSETTAIIDKGVIRVACGRLLSMAYAIGYIDRMNHKEIDTKPMRQRLEKSGAV